MEAQRKVGGPRGTEGIKWQMAGMRAAMRETPVTTTQESHTDRAYTGRVDNGELEEAHPNIELQLRHAAFLVFIIFIIVLLPSTAVVSVIHLCTGQSLGAMVCVTLMKQLWNSAYKDSFLHFTSTKREAPLV